MHEKAGHLDPDGPPAWDANVTKIHEDTPDIQPREVHHQLLDEMAHSPELDHFQIVCHWKNGKTTTGWSHGIRSHVMTFGATALTEAVRHAIFNTGH